MHSRIFVISKKPEDIDICFDEEDTRSYIRADYVVPSEDLEEDVEWLVNWLNDLLGQPTVKMEKIETEVDGEKKEIFSVYPVDAIISAFQEERRRKVERIREMLSKEPPDLFGIHLEAWSDWGFYFVVDPNHLEPTMGVLKILEREQKAGTLPDKLYVVDSYDYHI